MTELQNVLTEKGSLKSAVAANLKDQVRNRLGSLGFVTMPNGRMALEIASCDGHVITANIDLAIGVDTDFAKKAPKAKVAKEVEAIEIPDLF